MLVPYENIEAKIKALSQSLSCRRRLVSFILLFKCLWAIECACCSLTLSGKGGLVVDI